MELNNNTELFHVLWLKTNNLKVLPEEINYNKLKNKELHIFKLSFLDKYSANVIQYINTLVSEAFISKKFYDDYKSIIYKNHILSLYDSVAVFYMNSPKIVNFWKKIENDLSIKIKIFYGETEAIRHKDFINKNHFIEGINIIISCISDTIAFELNKKFNYQNKYFIGFKNTTHVYDSNIIKCTSTLKFLNKEFIESFDFKYIIGTESPIIQLINFMTYYFKLDKNVYFNEKAILDKLNFLKNKIINKIPFVKNDSYFKEEESNGSIQNINTDFINYFINKLEEPIVEINYSEKEYFI